MLEKLKSIKERYDVLTGELSKPEIIGNQENFASWHRNRRDLRIL